MAFSTNSRCATAHAQHALPITPRAAWQLSALCRRLLSPVCRGIKCVLLYKLPRGAAPTKADAGGWQQYATAALQG